MPKVSLIQYSRERRTAQQASGRHVQFTSCMAMSTVAMLPMLVLFSFFQRSFIQGIASSGIKE